MYPCTFGCKWRKVHALEQSCPCELCSLCSSRSNVHKKNIKWCFETLLFKKCTCAPRISFVTQSRVLELEEEKNIPMPYLGPSRPRHPKLCTWGRNVRGGYINIRLRTRVRKRSVVVMQSERDTWVHSALLALPAALPSSGKQTAREAKRCCCVSAQTHASDPAGVLPLPWTDAHVLALNDVAVPESAGASHARAVSRL